jgi:YkoY family integral membrane protein
MMDLLALFSQTFDPHDLVVVGLLVVLEGVLSIDNALVLGLLARQLPKEQQRRALTYGLVGAFVFRLISIAVAGFLLHWGWVKVLGGGYLIYISIKHFITAAPPEEIAEEAKAKVELRAPLLSRFWSTVIVIELTDIAFAVDSILAAIALVGRAPEGTPSGSIHPKLWVVVTGGMLGVILMRFAAQVFILLLDKFPRLESAAYLLVMVIGLKLLVDWAAHTYWPDSHLIDFHSTASPAFWTFWVLMAVCFAVGFIPRKPQADDAPVQDVG